jgi:hypothetical protein
MVLTLFSIHRSRKQDQNHFDIVTKHLMMIESKVGDLNVRVSMTEVRLEERKPQALLSAPNRSKRRNSRKPKEST